MAYALVKVNPDPPHPRTCGALSRYWPLFESPVCGGFAYFDTLFYTCQLFLRYKRDIFILGVLGALKTTRSFLKIPEEVRSHSKKSEVFRRRPKSSEVLGRV